MREILFRAKRLDNGGWVEGDLRHGGYTNNDSETYIMKSDYALRNIPVDPETVCQFTGLTDKNGKKIFEGDICKHRSNYSGDFIISVVTFTDGQFLVMADNNSGFNLSEKLEVIGNIFDNPELMEGGEADETD